MALSGGVETKLNASEQLQTFPYPTISKSLLQHLLGEHISINNVIQEHDGQTNKKSENFGCPGAVQNLRPKLGTVIENFEHILAPQNVL